MPNWNGTLLTAKGRSLQAKVEAGAAMNITKLKIGDGTLGGGQTVDALTDLLSPKKNLGISALTPLESGVCKITSVVTNAGLTAGFYVRELGIFAQDPDLGEILYAYTADGSPDYLPAEGGTVAVAEELVVQLAFSNAANIKATISLDGLVTTAILNAHKNTAVIDHPDGSVTDAKIGNRTITDTTTAAATAGTLTAKLSQLGYMIKGITGKGNWYTTPATTLENANTHMTATVGIHGATNANTASSIVQRDASGNFIAGTITAILNGLAATATKLATARTIALSGKATGTATAFDGSGNIVIPVTAVTADSCSGNAATATTATKLATARTIALTGDITGSGSFDGSNNLSIATSNTAAMPVGFTFPLLANSPLPGSLALQGALASRAAYPDLWAWVQANAPLITEAAWQAQAAVQTSVGAYSSGDGSTTFRLPKIVDFVRGSDTGRTSGTWQADAMQGHGHKVYMTNAGTTVAPGAVVPNGDAAAVYNMPAARLNPIVDVYAEEEVDNGYGVPRISDETRSKSISMLWCVKAFGASTNQGVVDITALAGSLNDKIGKTDVGYGTQVWVSGEYTPVVNTPTIVSHGLAINPLKAYGDVLLKCVVAEAGYSAGDYAISFVEWCGSAVEYAAKPVVTATTIQQNTGNYGLYAINKTSGTPSQLVPSNWRYVFRIRY